MSKTEAMDAYVAENFKYHNYKNLDNYPLNIVGYDAAAGTYSELAISASGSLYTRAYVWDASSSIWTPQPLTKLDNSGAPVTIDYPHYRIHTGATYTTGYDLDTSNGASLDILVVTPNTTVRSHFTYEIVAELEAHFTMYEGVTTSNNGTALPSYNRNRNSANTSTLLTYHTPTVSNLGSTLLRRWHSGSGRAYGGGDRGTHEFILKQNTSYLLRITNSTTNNNYMAVKLDWYETS